MSEALPPIDTRKQAARAGLRVAGVFLLLGGLWILLSDRALNVLAQDAASLTRLQTYKGWAFVLATGLLLYLMVFRELWARLEEEGRFRALVEQTLAGVYVIQERRFRYGNRKLAKILGYPLEELLASVPVLDTVLEEERPEVAEKLERRLRGEEQGVRFGFRVRRKNGKILHVECFGNRAEWEGRPAVVGILLDVTRRLQEEARARRNQELVAVGEFAAAVTHDFHNLLAVILTSAELLLADQKPGSPQEKELGAIRDTGLKAASLTRQLLTYSRKRVREPRVLCLNSVLGRLEPTLRQLAGDGVRLVLRLEPELEPVEMDPTHLERLLFNLVVNAREALPGGGEVHIETDMAILTGKCFRYEDRFVPGSYVQLVVSDSGPGIPPEIRSKIFDPFFTTKKTGFGLGLSTVMGVVRESDGLIRAEEAPAGGARFRIFLPASSRAAEAAGPPASSRAAEAAEPPGQQPAKAPKAGKPGGKKTLLVVEDEDEVRRVLVAALGRFGYTPLGARNGEEARRIAREHPGVLDLFLVDVGLPDVPGLALAEELLQLRPGAQALLMSGSAADEVLGAGPANRRFGFLEKPFSMEELLGKVRLALEGPGGEIGERAG